MHEALSHSDWKQAMIEEMTALHSSGTWDLVTLPASKSLIGCCWVYTMKIDLDGWVDRLKTRLVAKGYTHISMVYTTMIPFSPVAKIVFVLPPVYGCYAILALISVVYHECLDDLAEEVYMEQPPTFCEERRKESFSFY